MGQHSLSREQLPALLHEALLQQGADSVAGEPDSWHGEQWVASLMRSLPPGDELELAELGRACEQAGLPAGYLHSALASLHRRRVQRLLMRLGLALLALLLAWSVLSRL